MNKVSPSYDWVDILPNTHLCIIDYYRQIETNTGCPTRGFVITFSKILFVSRL